jgi:hypothetical protein
VGVFADLDTFRNSQEGELNIGGVKTALLSFRADLKWTNFTRRNPPESNT